MARPKLSNLPLSALQAEINRRLAKLSSLIKKRDQLNAQIEKLENIAGAKPATGRKRGRPAKKRGPGRPAKSIAKTKKVADGKKTAKMPLIDLLAKILSSKKPMPVTAIVKAAKSAGYKSKSSKFHLLVNQILSKSKDKFKTAGRGIYTLA